MKQWREQWECSKNGRLPFQLFERPSRACQIRSKLKIPANRKMLKLQVGRGNFLFDSPYCETCDEEFDEQHLFECIEYEEEREDLERYCTSKDIPLAAELLLHNKSTGVLQRLVKQYISRIPLDI